MTGGRMAGWCSTGHARTADLVVDDASPLVPLVGSGGPQSVDGVYYVLAELLGGDAVGFEGSLQVAELGEPAGFAEAFQI